VLFFTFLFCSRTTFQAIGPYSFSKSCVAESSFYSSSCSEPNRYITKETPHSISPKVASSNWHHGYRSGSSAAAGLINTNSQEN